MTINSSGGGGGGGGGTVGDGDITTIKLANDAVTSDKIADNAVTSDKIHNDVVDSYITAGTNITLTKDNASGVVTINSSGGGGGGGGGTTLSVDTISESTDASGVTIDSVLLKDNTVTAHTVTAQNYAVGGTNFISASRQGNFRDLEVKDNNNNATILLTGDDGDITLSGSIKQWIP